MLALHKFRELVAPSWRVLTFLFCLAASLAFGQEDYVSSKLSTEKYLELAATNQQAGDLKEATRYLNSAAMKVWEEKNFTEAIQYFNQSIELNKELNNVSGIAKINSNLGMIYFDLRDFEKSLIYFQLSLDYRLKHGEKTEIISTYINKAVVLNSLNRHSEAAHDLEEALRLATEMSDAPQMKSCYGMLAETYEKVGNQEKTIHYFNLYRTFHEMVQRNRINDAKKETEAAKLAALQLELDKKEKELQLLEKSKELEMTESEIKEMNADLRALLESGTKQELAISLLEHQLELDTLKISDAEARNKAQKLWLVVIVVGLLLLISFALMLYRNYRYKKKINVKLSAQNEEIKTLNEQLEEQVKKRTAQLQKTLENLEKRNRDLDQFSHVISHNLRGPVANILGLGKVINLKNFSDPINIEVFDRLLKATENLDAIVKDLSIILQVQDNQSVPKETVEINSIIDSVKNSLRSEIENSKAEFSIENKKQEVQLVKPYFESITYNLISNAIKYRAPQRPPRVRIESFVKNNYFEFKISDNGKGIHDNDLEKIFQPYKRLTFDGDGKGLGLYMVKTQVETMGGTIEVVSEEGKGSSFFVRIPQDK